jgi:type IV secretory pathway VirB6-like protein
MGWRGSGAGWLLMLPTVTFVGRAAARVANLQAVMNTVLGAEQTVLFPILRALMIIFIGRQFFLTMTGNMTINRFIDSIIRAGIIILLVTHSGAFVQWVATPVFTRVPMALTTMGAGAYASTTGAQSPAAQFDSVSAGGDATVGLILAQAEITSPSSWINALTAFVSDGCFQVILNCIFAIWLLGIGVLAIALCIGPPFLLFELFERTRGFVDQWIAKLVGFSAFGFATSIVLAMQMQGMVSMVQQAKTMSAINLPAAVGMLIHCVADSVMDLLLMAACPLAFGFGSGAVAALAAPSALLAMRSLSVGAAIGKSLASGTARSAGRGANAISGRR